MHYVIGDVHGCYDDLMMLLSKIEAKDNDANFIFVGDFIDRGPKVWECLQFMMKNITAEGKYQSVLGNHEELIIRWYKEWCYWWNIGGGEDGSQMPETQYDFSACLQANNCMTKEKVKPIIDFFKKLPFRKEIEIPSSKGGVVKYEIVHAWDTFEEEDEAGRETLNVWSRDCTGNYMNDTIIIHGHTPTISFEYSFLEKTTPGMIGYRKNAINVDGGCCFGPYHREFPCMLCGICLETLEEIYPYSLEDRFWELNKAHMTEDSLKQKIESFKQYYFIPMNKYRMEILSRL